MTTPTYFICMLPHSKPELRTNEFLYCFDHLKPPMAHAEHRHGSSTDEKPLFMRKRRFSISTVPRTIRLMFLFGTSRQSIAKMFTSAQTCETPQH